MSGNIKPWGCGKTKESRRFKERNGKPVVVIDTSVECRYSNIVPEEQEQQDEEDLILEIDPEELEEEETADTNPEDRPQHLQPSPLNERRIGKAHLNELAQQKTEDKEMQRIRNDFKRFLSK